MKILSADYIPDYVSGIIHEDTQLHARSLDLTVQSIHRPVEAGALDFGGSEFVAAGMETLEAIKRDSGDDYAWWNLQSGMYQAHFNENFLLGEQRIAIVSLHQHMIEAGISGSSEIIGTGGAAALNFTVPGCGCNIKENARIATALIFED